MTTKESQMLSVLDSRSNTGALPNVFHTFQGTLAVRG